MGGLFGGGSSKQLVAPPSGNDNNSNDALLALIAQLGHQQQMSMAMSQQSASQTPPPVIQVPPIQKSANIDWSEKQAQLAAKMKADYGIEQARKKGVSQTIHTSPLLDDEDPKTTGTLVS
jgi:hypothetical protein